MNNRNRQLVIVLILIALGSGAIWIKAGLCSDQKTIPITTESPIIVESLPEENLIQKFGISSLSGTLLGFLLSFLTFRFQNKKQIEMQKEKEERDARRQLQEEKKEEFNLLIASLYELKRGIDRCSIFQKNFDKRKSKSFATIYVRGDETLFPALVKLCPNYEIISKIINIYSLFKLVNWNIDIGLEPVPAGNQFFQHHDRYFSAIGFINTYFWGACDDFNNILEYASELNLSLGVTIPDSLKAYDLNKIEERGFKAGAFDKIDSKKGYGSDTK